MYENLTETEIEFLGFYYDPVAMLENIMPININAPSQWNEDSECIVENTQVLMENFTTKNIQDVNIGDRILTFGENKREYRIATVLNKMDKKVQECIRLTTENNIELECTLDHKILSKSVRNSGLRWLSAENTLNHSVITVPYKLNSYYDYLLGQLLGWIDSDGTLVKRDDVIRHIKIYQKTELQAVIWLLNELKIDYHQHEDRKDFYSFKLKVSKPDVFFKDLLSKLDNNTDFQYGYLCGFILGDGCWDANNASWGVTQKKIPQNIRLRTLLKKFNLNNTGWKDRKDLYRYHISKYSLPLYNPKSVKIEKFMLDSKNKGVFFQPNFKNRVVKIELIGKRHVWDLTTTEGTFLANNILVHNCVTVRNYQFAILGYDYLYEKDNKKTPKQNMNIKKGAGDIINISARNLGKSFLGLVGDNLLALLHYSGIESCIASFDEKHLKEISEKICNFVEGHKLFKMLNLVGGKKTVGRSPHRVLTKHGHLQIGVNEKVSGKNIGTDFHGKHYERFGYDEACVDRNTLIRYVDKNNNQKTERISTFINSGRWKNNLVYSYNFKTQQIELKKIVDIFKKNVKNYKYNSLFVQGFGNTKERHLIVSQNQKIMTDGGYKDVSELKPGETLYTFDYIKLTDIQKQIALGTLLGDANINLKRNNHNPNMSFTHSIHQKKYLEYKRNCFKNLFFSFHRQNMSQNITFKETSFGGNVGRLTTDTCVDLKEFINFKKPSLNKALIRKHFSEISLAFWLMDDGQLQGTKGKLNSNKKIIFNTCGFSKEDNLFLIEILKEKLNVDFELETHKDKYYRVVASGENFEKTVNICKKYIHPTMLYKIYSNYELCHLIDEKHDFSFVDLSKDIKYLLQETKLLRKTEELQSSWTMYDIEVEDNHNFFANGILISNSYMSEVGTEKRIDSGSSNGYVERLFGIPDLRIGSPLGSILTNKKNKNFICRLPQFLRDDWDDQAREQQAEKYGGESSMSYKLNVVGELIEGAFSKYDMERIKKNCYNTQKKIKFFELNKNIFKGLGKVDSKELENEFESRISKKIIIDRLPCTQIIVASDIGTSASPSEITIFFKSTDGKWRYEYQISLFKMIPKEQARVFAWIYNKLGSCFVSLDCSNMDGGTIRQFLIDDYDIPVENLTEYKMGANIEVGLEKDDETGLVKRSRSGQPLIIVKNTKEWGVKCLEEVLYNGHVEIPYDEKFQREFAGFFEVHTGNRPSWGTHTTDHLHDSFLLFALCSWENEFKISQNKAPKKRVLGGIL